MPSSVASVLLIFGFLLVAGGAAPAGLIVGGFGAAFEILLFFGDGMS